ncbi:hypothetical protein V493_00788 [Pseudogymnoascus sp. VKM F-4281 (FW-2241)]|nr:hypothetical protein V493_00788 [Pseudogymnoascus sp. VKM F-4281 (FW-2241)]
MHKTAMEAMDAMDAMDAMGEDQPPQMHKIYLILVGAALRTSSTGRSSGTSRRDPTDLHFGGYTSGLGRRNTSRQT